MTDALAALIDAFNQFLYLPDPGIILVTLATVAANRMSGDSLWVLLVGPPGSGKTEAIDALGCLPDIYPVSSFSEAGLLSGSPKKDGATGGLLIEMGASGILAFKDFTTLLSEHPSTRNRIFACLREVYDGAYHRRLGTGGGTTYSWEGKAGLIGGVTEAIDTVDLGLLGERFVYYRLPVLDDKAILTTTLAAITNAGRQHELRRQLADTVATFLDALPLPDALPPLCEADQDHIIVLADFAARCRSPVVRNPRDREIDLVPTAERPTRLAAQLAQLLGGLRAIGLGDPECWRIVTQVALAAMHSGRRRILGVLLGADQPMATAAVAGHARLTTSTAERHVQDLNAHSVIDHVGDHPDRWLASDWCQARWHTIREPLNPFDPESA